MINHEGNQFNLIKYSMYNVYGYLVTVIFLRYSTFIEKKESLIKNKLGETVDFRYSKVEILLRNTLVGRRLNMNT